MPQNAVCKVKTICANISVYGHPGALNLKSISGNIIVTDNTTDIDANSISGFVDVTVSPNTKADLEFKSISGTIYTNYELKTSVKKRPGSTRVADQMNGGGAKIALSTISGNVFFRLK